MTKEIQDLEEISASVAHRPDFVQGGGGNTSVKSEAGKMVIKASGFELKEVNAGNGFTIVNAKAIADYFRQVDAVTNAIEQEKASIDFILQQMVETGHVMKLRPSMETGFHSLLDKYVIHTHSVYSNIINCSREATTLLERVFATSSLKPLLIEYCNPGFELSVNLHKKAEEYKNVNGKNPQVIFLQSHGLIVSSNDKGEAITLHKEVNEVLKKAFSVKAEYPEILLKEISENIYECTSDYLIDKFRKSNPSQKFFDRVLFPDQTVFFNNNFYFGSNDEWQNKINLNTSTFKITYKTKLKEARTIQETLTAYFYILEKIEENQCTPKFINQLDVDRINNMESEKYRRDLLK
jgi:rhamnose utilization protein RhaD (predicted bifunctional aldolase and dehydrogenase)